jgi:hypothetical protein
VTWGRLARAGRLAAESVLAVTLTVKSSAPAPQAVSPARDSLAMTAVARRGPGGYDQSWSSLFPPKGEFQI